MVTKRIAALFRAGLISLFFVLFFPFNSYAAAGSISVEPVSGNYSSGQTFQAALKIDGGGRPLNAAKANISVSEGLQIESLTLGDCGFAFVTTPSKNSPSFAGVILGGSENSCTVYTMQLKVVGGSNGFVYIADGSIKAYDNSEEIFAKSNNSSYSFKGTSSTRSVLANATPTQAPLVSDANGEKFYTLLYGIIPEGKSNGENLKVILDEGQPTQMIVVPSPSSDDPNVLTAVFDNVSEGVHTLEVFDKDNSISEEIVNVEGQNREISLGVAPKPSSSMLMYALAGLIIVTVLSVLIVGIVFILRKKRQGQLG